MPQTIDEQSKQFVTVPSRASLALLVCVAMQVASAQSLLAQIEYEPIEMSAPSGIVMQSESIVAGNSIGSATSGGSTSSNQMLWQQYQALQTGSASCSDGCQSCGSNGLSDYNRCGCNAGQFRWISGPGLLDEWCVGPKWGVEASGLFFFRDDADWNLVSNRLTALEPTTTNQLTEQFEHGPGVRIFATKYNEAGYGFQVGYEGINQWTGTATFLQEPAGDPVPAITRTATYESQFNSLEANFLVRTSSHWEVYSGFRYARVDEDFINLPTRDATNDFLTSSLSIDVGSSHVLQNNLFGFQLGSRRNAWNLGNRFTVEAFATGGVYCNKFDRRDIVSNTTTIIVEDDPATLDVNEFSQTDSVTTQSISRQSTNQIAFLGEAGVSGVWQLNPSLALRGGYEILAVDNVGQALDAFLNPSGGLDGSTLVFHGLQFGLEYRR